MRAKWAITQLRRNYEQLVGLKTSDNVAGGALLIKCLLRCLVVNYENQKNNPETLQVLPWIRENESAMLAVPLKISNTHSCSRTCDLRLSRFACCNISLECCGHSLLDHVVWIAWQKVHEAPGIVICFVGSVAITFWIWVVYWCDCSLVFSSYWSVLIFSRGVPVDKAASNRGMECYGLHCGFWFTHPEPIRRFRAHWRLRGRPARAFRAHLKLA